MNDKSLMSFVTAAEKGSFYKAAQVLFTTPQTIVQQMNQLEQEVGMPLFERSNKGIRLTQAGRTFLIGAKEILNLTDETVKKCRGEYETSKEQIHIAIANRPHVLSEICIEFSRRFPHIELLFQDLPVGDWMSLITEGKVDIQEGDVSKEFTDLPIQSLCLFQSPRVCILSPYHPLAQKDVISIQDLTPYEIYVHNLGWAQQLKAKIQDQESNIYFREKRCILANVMEVCLNGNIYLAPRDYAPQFSPLVIRPLDLDVCSSFGLYYRKQHNHAVDCFLQVAREMFNIPQES